MIEQNKIIKIFFYIAFLTIFTGNAHSFDLEKTVSKTRLKNGVTVLLLERNISPTVSLYIRYRVGAVDELDGETGAAHLLEHMMFKGTTTIGAKQFKAEKSILDAIEDTGNKLDKEKSKGEKADPQKIKMLMASLKKLQTEHKKYFIANEIDRLYTENGGLDMNASTGQDITTYHVSLPSNKIELWARIESDRLMNPVFREFYTERDVVLEERRQRVETDPDGKLYEEFLRTAYQVHHYRRPIIGWKGDLENLSPASLKRIYKNYKKPENIVIAVVGNINPAPTLNLIEKYFGRLPAVHEKSALISAEPAQVAERRIIVTFDANPKLLIGYHKPAVPDHTDYVFDVLEAILTRGRTSRLYNTLVTEKRIAKNVIAFNGFPGARYPNLFVIDAEPRLPHNNSQLEDAIIQEIEKLKKQPVAPEELVKAKNHLRMEFIKSMDSHSKIASILSYYEVLLGNYQYFAKYLEMIEMVSSTDIQNVCNTYLNKENRTVALLVQKEE